MMRNRKRGSGRKAAILSVGEHSRATKVTGVIHLEKECIYQKLEKLLPLDCEMECIHGDKTLFYSYPEEEKEIKNAPDLFVESFLTKKKNDNCLEKQIKKSEQVP